MACKEKQTAHMNNLLNLAYDPTQRQKKKTVHSQIDGTIENGKHSKANIVYWWRHAVAMIFRLNWKRENNGNLRPSTICYSDKYNIQHLARWRMGIFEFRMKKKKVSARVCETNSTNECLFVVNVPSIWCVDNVFCVDYIVGRRGCCCRRCYRICVCEYKFICVVIKWQAKCKLKQQHSSPRNTAKRRERDACT